MARDNDPCQHCTYERKDHSYYLVQRLKDKGEPHACERFQLKPRTFEYRPPAGDRGADPAKFVTRVTCYVENQEREVCEIHTFHEAELRQLDKDSRTGMCRTSLVMPDRDGETGEFRDVDGDRSYRRRILYHAPGALYIQGGAWINIEGFCYFNPQDPDADSPWDAAAGPDGSFLTRIERWYQSVPKEALEAEEEPEGEVTVYD